MSYYETHKHEYMYTYIHVYNVYYTYMYVKKMHSGELANTNMICNCRELRHKFWI